MQNEARHMIEALRSGIPSRTVGQYFTEARPNLLRQTSDALSRVAETGESSCFIYTGKYGEGKTHLLNTVFNMAHQNNMVVSMLSIGKEAPLDKLHEIYPKIAANTYLPGHEQPGFMELFTGQTLNTQESSQLLLYAAKELECDKLYYVLKTYLTTQNPDLKYQLRLDMEGNFINMPLLKRSYKELFKETVHMSRAFSKTKNTFDYICFLSEMFRAMHYAGWVILFDEAEMIGHFSRKQRMNAYRNIARFLHPSRALKSVYSMFAFTASFDEDVIEKKHDFDQFAAIFPDDAAAGQGVISAISRAYQLMPLTYQEIEGVVERILSFHSQAYDWQPDCTVAEFMKVVDASGFLLRTKLRATIEYLDQLYLYGRPGKTSVGELEDIVYDEQDEVPDLEDLENESF